MTDCNVSHLCFASLGSKAVVADYCGGRLTADAGALMLREAADRIGLFEALDAAVPDPRHPRFIVHEQKALIAQPVMAVALGCEDLNDHQTLRVDPALQLAAGCEPDALASPPTMCRLENRVDRAALVHLAAVLVDQFVAAHAEPPEYLILDFDAADDPVHGRQEHRCFHGYYDHHCYLPLYVFCGDELLVAYLRPANIDASKHTRAVLKLLVRRLCQAWPAVKLTLRGDSGFCRWRLMRWCDSRGVGYVLGLARNPALERAARDATDQAAQRLERTGVPQRLFDAFAYATKSWDRPRRVIVKAEHNAQGANPRFIVSNEPGDLQRLCDEVYCHRGKMGNRIKELQLDLFAHRTSCHRFLAKPFRLLLSSAPYVLSQVLRRTTLHGTELAEAQVGTIRPQLLKVAAQVVVIVRRVVFQLASSYPCQSIFRHVHQHLTAPPPPVLGAP